ncbi:MAG: nitronate monooxygenase [Acidobacteriia bacterium]|nr:nitronate monooxygenase [Terriglobia bacterium]
MKHHDFLQRIGVEVPVVQAPMAGGLETPELTAAVGHAGGLGSLAAGYLSPDQIFEQVRRIRTLSDKPLSINLFAGGREASPVPDPEPLLALLREVHEAFGVPAPVLPAPAPDPFPDQFEAVIEASPEVFSFTFGVLSAEAIARLRQRGIAAIGTATTVDEARVLEERGVDAIVAQGAEAGAHRGTFLRSFESSMVPTLELVRSICGAVRVPVIASGGLMDGRDITRALECGACAAQLGTAFLTCPEAGTPEAHRKAVLSAKTDTTAITRAYSGRPARGLRNTFMDRVAAIKESILPFPLQNTLTRSMRAAAAKAGDAGYLSLWAGQGVTRARVLPAAELVARLAAEVRC